jgi:hypothetical protein
MPLGAANPCKLSRLVDNFTSCGLMFSLLGRERNEYFIPDPIGRRELEMDSPFDTTCQVHSPAWPLRINGLGLCRWQKLLGERPRMEIAAIWTDMS